MSFDWTAVSDTLDTPSVVRTLNTRMPRAAQAIADRPSGWTYLSPGVNAAQTTAQLQAALNDGANVALDANATYVLSAQLKMAVPNTALLGWPSTLVQLAANTTVADTDTSAPAVLWIASAGCRVGGFRLDGNKSSNSQNIHAIIATAAATDLTLGDLRVANVQGTVGFGGAIALRNVVRAHLSRLTLHDNNSDGLNIFRGCQDVAIAGLVAYNNGILGIDIEGTAGVARPAQITLTGARFANNAAGDIGVWESDDVMISGVTVRCGTVAPAENNYAVSFGGSTNCTLSDFSILGPGAGISPHGIGIDDQMIADRVNDSLVIGPGTIRNMAGDGIHLGRGGSVFGSTNVTMVGVQSRNNTGWGLNVVDAALDSNMTVAASTFTNNTAGAATGFTSIATRISVGNNPAI